jgi:tetratricopeptide (TPR) repeat protein
VRSLRRWSLGALVVICGGALLSGAATHPSAQASPLRGQLDRYLLGDFATIEEELSATKDFGDFLKALKRDGPAWIDAGPAETRAKRQLAAATFALEAARAAENEDWKWVQIIKFATGPPPTDMVDLGFLKQSSQPEPALWWKPPPHILEWGCELLRNGKVPQPLERVWHLAAVAVAERRSDHEFLIGSPWEARENAKDEINHLEHVLFRFPDEPRFALAQAIAMDWRTWSLRARHGRNDVDKTIAGEAMRAFERQLKDPAIGAEASLRLAVLRLRLRNFSGALELFDRVETMTRDRYLVYLSRLFSGLTREKQNRPADAEKAYRGALATIPKAISASMSLAAVLARGGRMTEATAIVEAAVTTNPPVVDPWRTYNTADDRFWPVLIARLHGEIKP